MCVWCVTVCVCVLFVDLFQDTTEEPLRRHKSVWYCQVLSNHSGQVGKLLFILLPPHQNTHQRVCVVGHLLDLNVSGHGTLHTDY